MTYPLNLFRPIDHLPLCHSFESAELEESLFRQLMCLLHIRRFSAVMARTLFHYWLLNVAIDAENFHVHLLRDYISSLKSCEGDS